MRVSPIMLLLSACLLASPALQAASKVKRGSKSAASLGAMACVFDADRTAFDIEGLKSQLMVTAETCGADAKSKFYTFQTRFQPEVKGAEEHLMTYFKRSFGRAGTDQFNDYTTQLALNQEQIGLKAGTAYCENLNAMYDEVLSLHDGTELHDYSNAKMLYQPVAFETCTGAPPAAIKTRTRHKTKHA